MKSLNYLFTFALLILALSVSAQYEIGAYTYNQSIVKYVNSDAKKIKEANILTRTQMQEKIGKNGLPSKSSPYAHYIYNEQGQILREDFYYGKKKLQRSVSYTYNDKNQVVSKAITYKKDKTPELIIELSYFNDSLISELNFIRKGKKTYGYRYFYAPDGKITEQRGYKKAKVISRIEYDYYDDGSKKEVRYYEDSLKLEKTFRYDCGIGNSLLSQKQKDTLTRCSKKEDLGDGTVRTIEETRDEKGRIRRVITDSNKDQKWFEVRYYDSKNRLTYTFRSETQADNKRKVKYTLYRKGKEKKQFQSFQWIDNMGFFAYQGIEKDRVDMNTYSTYTFRSSIN